MWCWSCGRLKVVPEISNALVEDTMLDLKKEDDAADKIIAINSELVLFTQKGKIFRLNPEKKMVDFLYSLTSPIDADIFHQKDLVILKKKKANDFTIFDLREMKEIKTLENLDADKIICANRTVIGYRQGDQMIFMDHSSGKIVKKQELQTDTVFFNSEIIAKEGKTLILASDRLYIYDNRRHTLETKALKHKAVSGFLPDGNSIYYGSEGRELVRLSWPSNRVKWRFKLAEQLKLAPLKAGKYIVITPEDNNIYFFNGRGTLYWWQKFNSTRKLPPVKMKENAAVFLWDKTFKFFNYKKKQVVTYPFLNPAHSNLVCIDEYVYMLSQDATGKNPELNPITLIKLGNNFGVEIKTIPEYIIPMGKSIKFNLKKFNLIEPNLNIKIIDHTGESVFQKTIPDKQDPSFVWIPDRAEEFKLVIEINSKNKNGLIIEESFDVIDVDKILEDYYYRLQKRSQADQVVRCP
jgi:hypothetical protein